MCCQALRVQGPSGKKPDEEEQDVRSDPKVEQTVYYYNPIGLGQNGDGKPSSRKIRGEKLSTATRKPTRESERGREAEGGGGEKKEGEGNVGTRVYPYTHKTAFWKKIQKKIFLKKFEFSEVRYSADFQIFFLQFLG